MTREEVMTIIGNLEDKDILFNPCDVQDAKTMAIEALEQEPSGDAISRQAVLDAIAANCIRENEYNLTSSRIKKAVENLSPVKQEPKTGHWIDMDEGFSPCKCSECESVDFIKSKYCPNCGAKMESEG